MIILNPALEEISIGIPYQVLAEIKQLILYRSYEKKIIKLHWKLLIVWIKAFSLDILASFVEDTIISLEVSWFSLNKKKYYFHNNYVCTILSPLIFVIWRSRMEKNIIEQKLTFCDSSLTRSSFNSDETQSVTFYTSICCLSISSRDQKKRKKVHPVITHSCRFNYLFYHFRGFVIIFGKLG